MWKDGSRTTKTEIQFHLESYFLNGVWIPGTPYCSEIEMDIKSETTKNLETYVVHWNLTVDSHLLHHHFLQQLGML